MRPQRTNIHCIALDAHEHIFASAGARAFVNESSGAATLPAPFQLRFGTRSSNAQTHLLLEAGATQERRLEAVRCSARLCENAMFW
jgi:hypothetical protein